MLIEKNDLVTYIFPDEDNLREQEKEKHNRWGVYDDGQKEYKLALSSRESAIRMAESLNSSRVCQYKWTEGIGLSYVVESLESKKTPVLEGVS